MPIRCYCRIPKFEKNSVRSPEGSCPELMYNLFEEIEDAKEIHIAAYLFNNPIYSDFLVKLAQKGCKIFITTIPLLGYSTKKVKVSGYEEKISGYDSAVRVFDKISKTKNIKLSIFPHQYIWYGALYARGGASYSFHIKAVNAKFSGGKTKCMLSSGNFMFTDPYHSDNLIIFENENEYENSFNSFFNDLNKYTIPFKKVDKLLPSYSDEFLFSLDGKEIDLDAAKYSKCFFSSPFYTFNGIGSNHYAGNKILDIIKNGKHRIWICAQHFHDLVSFDKERNTIINAIYNKYLEKPNIEFKFLKQVPHSSLADKRRAAIAETLFQFVMGVEQRVNKLVHDKFIIVDNNLFVSTANYTSTQFAYGKRKMDMKEKDTKYRKIDNFSEVNGFALIPDCPKDVMRSYEAHFNSLWDNGTVINIEL